MGIASAIGTYAVDFYRAGKGAIKKAEDILHQKVKNF